MLLILKGYIQVQQNSWQKKPRKNSLKKVFIQKSCQNMILRRFGKVYVFGWNLYVFGYFCFDILISQIPTIERGISGIMVYIQVSRSNKHLSLYLAPQPRYFFMLNRVLFSDTE